MALGQRFVIPNQFAVDATGVPYIGGQLFFYASGTSTPQNTYQDPGLTIPNFNPVIADSAGRFGNVFLQTLPYKVVLEDSLGNQIWSLDPVSSSSSVVLGNQTITASGQAISSLASVIYIHPSVAGAGTYPLPGAPSVGETHWIKCTRGDESANNQTISGNGHTIDGAASFVMAFPFQSICVSFGGTEWGQL